MCNEATRLIITHFIENNDPDGNGVAEIAELDKTMLFNLISRKIKVQRCKGTII